MAAFANRVALVTGGSRGIGRATAVRLAEDGADVAISYISRTKEAQEAVAADEALGRRAAALPCDVSKPDDVQRLVDQTREKLGPIELLVRSAVISNLRNPNHLNLDVCREIIA